MEAYLPFATTCVNSIVPLKLTSPYCIPLGEKDICIYCLVAIPGSSGDLFVLFTFMITSVIAITNQSFVLKDYSISAECPKVKFSVSQKTGSSLFEGCVKLRHLLTAAQRFAPKLQSRAIPLPIKRTYSRGIPRRERKEERKR